MVSVTSSNPEVWLNRTLTYVALTLGVAALVKYLFTSRLPSNLPPFPARPYPILGHLPYFKNGMREQLTEWTKSTGDIFSLYFGSQLTIILSGYDITHQAFVKHGDTLSDRPKTIATGIGNRDPNKGIVFCSGPVWKEQRTVSLHILRSFGLGKNILSVKIGEEVSAYLRSLQELKGKPSEIRTLTGMAVSNNICSILVGKRFEYDDDYFISFIKEMEKLSRLSESSSLSTLMPWLQYIPGDMFNAKKRAEIFENITVNFCYRYIEKTKKEGSDSTESFITAYLEEKKRLEEQGQVTTLDDENLARTIFGLLMAGTEVTASSLQWFMLYMLHYPDVQRKIFEEISDVVGLERTPNMHDKAKLNFTNAAIMETQRINITPMNVPHTPNRDTVIKGYTIPAGAMVLAFFDAPHLFPDLWEDPKAFRPERFLDAQGIVRQPEHFMPFGIGRRVCPGESMAKMKMFLFVTTIIQRFELQPAVPSELPSLKPVEGLVYTPQPYQIRFVDRKKFIDHHFTCHKL